MVGGKRPRQEEKGWHEEEAWRTDAGEALLAEAHEHRLAVVAERRPPEVLQAPHVHAVILHRRLRAHTRRVRVASTVARELSRRAAQRTRRQRHRNQHCDQQQATGARGAARRGRSVRVRNENENGTRSTGSLTEPKWLHHSNEEERGGNSHESSLSPHQREPPRTGATGLWLSSRSHSCECQ